MNSALSKRDRELPPRYKLRPARRPDGMQGFTFLVDGYTSGLFRTKVHAYRAAWDHLSDAQAKFQLAAWGERLEQKGTLFAQRYGTSKPFAKT